MEDLQETVRHAEGHQADEEGGDDENDSLSAMFGRAWEKHLSLMILLTLGFAVTLYFSVVAPILTLFN